MSIATAAADIALAFETDALAIEFSSRYTSLLRDLSETCADDWSSDALLWLGADSEALWIVCVARGESGWHGEVVQRNNLGPHDGTGLLTRLLEFQRCTRRENAKAALDILRSSAPGLGLPDSFPLFSEAGRVRGGQARRLTVKLEPACDWFSLMPLESLATSSHEASVPWFVEWVMSEKTFLRNLSERKQINQELLDVPTFLAHAVIVLNTYRMPGFDARLVRTTERMADLLRLLRNVTLQIGLIHQRFTLRTLVNPTPDDLASALHDPDTWFVLANFHVVDGRWQLGDEHGDFDVKSLVPQSLRHIRLLRVFHCNSAFDRTAPDAFRASIVNALLQAGAMRVEGSPFIEYYVVFLRQLVNFIAERPSLHVVLKGQAAAHGIDLDRLIHEIRLPLD